MDAPDPVLDLVTFYTKSLAVPQRRNIDDPTVPQGKQLFTHPAAPLAIRKFVTGSNTTDSMHSCQLIWPYSDFLLHDMGEELADGQPVDKASGRQ